MNRSKSASKNESEFESDTLAEAELLKYEKTYRIMENDKEAYQNETVEKIRRQRMLYDDLLKEKEELQKNLSLTDSLQNKEKDNRNKEILTQLIQEKDSINAEIEDEHKKCQTLDAKIREKSRLLKKRLRETGGQAGSSDAAKQRTSKETRMLENRLDYALGRFGKQLNHNAKQRKEIEDCRFEKTRFDQVFRKLEKYNDEIRKEIGEVIEQSNAAYEQRDEAQTKMLMLKDKADKDQQQHQTEMRELQRIIDHDRKLKEFMSIKSLEREEDDYTRAQRKKREEELAARKAREPKDTVATYEEAFLEIREITGEEDLDTLVSKFIETEDKNFALFNFINEQNNDIEARHEDIQQLETEIDDFEKNNIRLEEGRQEKLQEMEARQKLISKQADEDGEKLKSTEKILDQLKSGVNSLFSKIDCDRSSIDELLGAKEGIKDSNMIQYLGIVEQRTDELLTIKNYQDSKVEIDYERGEKAPEPTPGLLGEGPKPRPQAVFIIPPSTGDDYDSDASEASDEEARPYSIAELKSKIMKNVQKKDKEVLRQVGIAEVSNADRKKSQKKAGGGGTKR